MERNRHLWHIIKVRLVSLMADLTMAGQYAVNLAISTGMAPVPKEGLSRREDKMLPSPSYSLTGDFLQLEKKIKPEDRPWKFVAVLKKGLG